MKSVSTTSSTSTGKPFHTKRSPGRGSRMTTFSGVMVSGIGCGRAGGQGDEAAAVHFPSSDSRATVVTGS